MEANSSESETCVPSLKGFMKHYNQKLCISLIARCFTKRLQLKPDYADDEHTQRKTLQEHEYNSWKPQRQHIYVPYSSLIGHT